MDYAAARDRPDLAKRASRRRVAYVFLMCVVTLLTFTVRGRVTLTNLPAVVTAVCLLVLAVMVLHLIHRVRTEVAVNSGDLH